MSVSNSWRVAAMVALGGVAALAFALTLPGADAAATKCFGKTPTIRGNGVTINGTNGNDVILAGDGDNQVNAKDGKDYVCTRGGGDNIDGGKGRTYARGGADGDNFEGRGA